MAEATTSGLRWVGRAALALLCFGLLVFAVAPSQRSTEPPPLGPSTQEFVALRDFQDAVPVPDVKAQRDRAAAAVPVRYGLKSNLVTE